jgi:hypothetical protein
VTKQSPDIMNIENFLNSYGTKVQAHIHELRKLIAKTIPGIKEELDLSARIIGCGFGPGYQETICTIIPSKKALKVGFFRGTELPDPKGLLQGLGKVHKYVEIRSEGDIRSAPFNTLLKEAHKVYKKRKKMAPGLSR